jgi:ABC-2 type transport system ATP-binding protein
MNCIEVENISKRFGPVNALTNINLKFEPNKIYGLLGRNGAGKSTLLNIITNRLFANSGQVLIDGIKAAENDEVLGKVYMMSEKCLYPEGMKIAKVLKWSNEFYPGFDLDYARRLADEFGLELNKKVKNLSTGYGSIMKLVVALAVNTPYLLLDEPVLGLDANHREMFYRILVQHFAQRPSTIVLSTHLIEEVATVIEEVVIIKDGKILKNESCASLTAKGYTVSGSAAAVDSFVADKQVIGSDSLGGLKSVHILGIPNKKNLPQGLEISRLDLQKLFIKLTSA